MGSTMRLNTAQLPHKFGSDLRDSYLKHGGFFSHINQPAVNYCYLESSQLLDGGRLLFICIG